MGVDKQQGRRNTADIDVCMSFSMGFKHNLTEVSCRFVLLSKTTDKEQKNAQIRNSPNFQRRTRSTLLWLLSMTFFQKDLHILPFPRT